MSTIGGMNSNSLLPYLDYDALVKDPKIFVGYSDVTAILLAVYAKTGLITFYGPALVASFGEFEPLVSMTYRSFEDVCINEPSLPYRYTMPDYWTNEYIEWEEQSTSKKQKANRWITVEKGRTQGRVIGGNLHTMQGVWGSSYMPKIMNGDILFIENSVKDAATLERLFSLLKVNKVFKKVSGIIIGKNELFDEKNSGMKSYKILQEVLNGQSLPILADFDCAHTHPMFTLPIGIEIELDATEKTISLISDWYE
jgi:muramoyltetrapeptide carboxypeptidase LdcA involved in peptidoglycan recycling